MNNITRQYVVMGVSGCGKSTVASLLASRTGGIFLEGDHFHSVANKQKMAAAIPLSDEDRWPWLEALNRKLREHATNRRAVFLACSALRQTYRDRLAGGLTDLQFIFLEGSKAEIRARLESRKNHFMPPALLDSQFANLEKPSDAIVEPIADSAEAIVNRLLQRLAVQPLLR